MCKILVVFTGGTIGSTTINGTIDTEKKQGYKLLELFEKSSANSQELELKIIQPAQLLSENLFPSFWETLIGAIEAEGIAQFDGIIITHGTDTLAFTAAALSLYFNSAKIPLLLVSSAFPLDHPQSNGLSNFICATSFIYKKINTGVFVPYKNSNATTQVHRGSRLASCLQLSSDFISVNTQAPFRFEDNQFIKQSALGINYCRYKQPLMPNFSSHILLIRPYPGLDYSVFNLDNVDVILHDLYHSGTACSIEDWGGNHSLALFIDICEQRGIALYMAPAIKSDALYDSSKILLEQGAKMIWNISLESAYAKLLLAYGNFKDSEAIDVFLNTNIAFECIEEINT